MLLVSLIGECRAVRLMLRTGMGVLGTVVDTVRYGTVFLTF